MHTETLLDRSLWVAVLAVAAAFVIANFARGPLLGSDGEAANLGSPLTLWVAGDEAGGEAQTLARQMAACRQLEGRAMTVSVLPGDSTQAIGEFLQRARNRPDELLLITSGTLAEIARGALQPAGSEPWEDATRAANLLMRSTPVAMLGSDAATLAVRSGSPLRTTAELLASMRSHPLHPLLGVAEDPWLQSNLAALAQTAGVRGTMPFSVFRSSREAVVSVSSGEQPVVLAPRSALAVDLRRGTLEQLSWPEDRPFAWMMTVAPGGLDAHALGALRGQASSMCNGNEWRWLLRRDGLSPTPIGSSDSLRRVLRSGLQEASRLQELAMRTVRSY